MTVKLDTRRFSVTDYYKMVEAGILKEDDRVELLDGEIVVMSPIGHEHSYTVTALIRAVHDLADRAILRVQDPVRLGEYREPQPDLVLVRMPLSRYGAGHPKQGDVLLLVEVSDTSLAVDRGLKLTMYAEAGIREYWIVDIVARQIEVLRSPEGGRYAERTVLKPGEMIRPVAFPDFEVEVAGLFPPAS